MTPPPSIAPEQREGEQEPDQIDMMSEEELRTELRALIKKTVPAGMEAPSARGENTREDGGTMIPADIEVLERYEGKDGHRDWAQTAQSWLYPGDMVCIIGGETAKRIDAAMGESPDLPSRTGVGVSDKRTAAAAGEAGEAQDKEWTYEPSPNDGFYKVRLKGSAICEVTSKGAARHLCNTANSALRALKLACEKKDEALESIMELLDNDETVLAWRAAKDALAIKPAATGEEK